MSGALALILIGFLRAPPLGQTYYSQLMPKQSKKPFLNSFNHFRALAIVVIVAGHTVELAGLEFNSFLENVFNSLIYGGTALFVFISGVLFYHIYYHGFVYTDFISRKAKNVFVPYVVLGVPVLTGLMLFRPEYLADSLASAPGDDSFGAQMETFTLNFLTGRFLGGYWYIPFIIVTFLMAPLHVRFVTLGLRTQIWLIAALGIVSLYIHRPVEDLLIPQAVVYYLPIYLLGILCSMHKEQVYRCLQGKEYFFLAAALLLAVVQALLLQSENFDKPPFEPSHVDWNFLQKVALCMFFMVWLHRFEHVRTYLIDIVATTSFAIYFLHPILLIVAFKVTADLQLFTTESWLAYPLLVATIILICVLIALATKRLLRKNSRLIIGY